MVTVPDRFQFELRADTRRWALHAIPCSAAPEPSPNAAVTTHVDCFHVHEDLSGAEVTVRVASAAGPTRYLLAVTARRLELQQAPTPARAAMCEAPPPMSQMALGPKLGPRVCSPTCITMLLARHGYPADLNSVAESCFDPVTNLYGIWPLAIRSAAHQGSLGAVELFDDWEEPLRVLEAGMPFAASIRFGEGGLPGAPLPRTGGHLVVVNGADPQDVRVNDPSAEDAASVHRRYRAAEFSNAWLRYRGAAYILLP
ncbi:MAG: hypothetical protein GWM88_16635 [Pseudomonadales bacterium]|nr:hypothetical protein [Pseudomonadales bacterium]NIX09559.1 hypothetical protein [Pseudomonadales bacterium]